MAKVLPVLQSIAPIPNVGLKAGETPTIAAENAATAHQLMSIFGWTTLQQAEIYTRAAEQTHAAVLGFEHPVSGEPMHFESDPPADLAGLIAALSS